VDIVTPATLAGAFILGTIVGFIAAMRVFRLVIEYLRKRND